MFNRSLTDKAAKDDAKPEDSLHIVREGTPKDLHVFVRGDVESPGPLAPRRFLPILARDPQPFTEGSGRKQLAEAIVDPGNPLTARVIVNRIWAAYFGRDLGDAHDQSGWCWLFVWASLAPRPSAERRLQSELHGDGQDGA